MRTDPHRPSEIIPADYQELFQYAYASEDCPPINLDQLQAQKQGKQVRGREPFRDAQGSAYTWANINGGRCDSCGASFLEGVAFLHSPSAQFILMGHTCAHKMGIAYDESEAQIINRQRKSARKKTIERRRKRDALREFAANAGKELLQALKSEHRIILDIRARLIQWGKISEKQSALVLKLYKEEQENRNKPKEVHVPVPIQEGRQRVQGRVVSVKLHENAYGSTFKVTVKVDTEDGSYLLWGTLPSPIEAEAYRLSHSIRGLLRGATIAFDAKLSAGDDPHFAFFKRPTKPSLISLDPSSAQEDLDKIQDDLDRCQADGEAAGEWEKGEKRKANTLMSLMAEHVGA